MILTDFDFDKLKLSDLGCIPCCITTEASDSVSLGSVLTLNQIATKPDFTQSIMSVSYDEPISSTFDIMKNPCSDDPKVFNAQEISYIMKWLNKKEFKRFYPIYDKDADEPLCYNGTFTTVEAIRINGDVIGFTLTFTSNSPWGFINREIKRKGVSEVHINNDSDDIGRLYPSLFEITPLRDCNLIITNNFSKSRTIINGCKAGETISFDSRHKVIKSSATHERLYNDFNYSYPCLYNTMTQSQNTFTFTDDGNPVECDVKIKFEISRKVGMIA